MSLSDLISHMDLSVFPEVALVIFAGVFVAVSARTLRADRAAFEAAAGLPIDDPAPAREEEPRE
ncbi:MAG: hypothetical protein D6731_13325 [Planctomycetota bacterium]|nr:MAG: hypothetical protein D6731_13325 [Planctomycetota bacterium]